MGSSRGTGHGLSDSKRTDEVEVGADLGSELFHDAAVTLLRVSEPTEVRFVVIYGPRVERPTSTLPSPERRTELGPTTDVQYCSRYGLGVTPELSRPVSSKCRRGHLVTVAHGNDASRPVRSLARARGGSPPISAGHRTHPPTSLTRP
jgi:hypothetical protein